MPDGEGWDRIEYAYDPAGRRIEKKVDGTTQVKYVYDGSHILAEYNNAGTLLRKYVHGPCVDEPICMIEASGTYAGTHYYHYDALGSCVAMTNSAGNVVQLYEYSVYGQVAASDADHPNRFMFTGREFEKDTGLYYYRARYYHPEIGRFLQTDPLGYGDGMNLYRYCRNGPMNSTDPLGLKAEPNRVRDKFEDMDTAAVAAFAEIWEKDDSMTYEYFFWIYQVWDPTSDPCITYGYTKPQRGTVDECPMEIIIAAGRAIPASSSSTVVSIVSWGHTHPLYDGPNSVDTRFTSEWLPSNPNCYFMCMQIGEVVQWDPLGDPVYRVVAPGGINRSED
jgi:RHS repeat-associated protein